MNQSPPRRFLFSSRYEGIGDFNSKIFVDVLKLADGPVLRAVCADTGFQAGGFLPDDSASSAWKLICACWLHVYAGASDHSYHEAGTNFASSDFRSKSADSGIVVHEVPTEAHHQIGIVERQHATLRKVY